MSHLIRYLAQVATVRGSYHSVTLYTAPSYEAVDYVPSVLLYQPVAASTASRLISCFAFHARITPSSGQRLARPERATQPFAGTHDNDKKRTFPPERSPGTKSGVSCAWGLLRSFNLR